MVVLRYEFSLIEGLSVKRRAIGFLDEIVPDRQNQELNAKRRFVSQKTKPERDLRGRFDYWIDEGPANDK